MLSIAGISKTLTFVIPKWTCSTRLPAMQHKSIWAHFLSTLESALAPHQPPNLDLQSLRGLCPGSLRDCVSLHDHNLQAVSKGKTCRSKYKALIGHTGFIFYPFPNWMSMFLRIRSPEQIQIWNVLAIHLKFAFSSYMPASKLVYYGICGKQMQKERAHTSHKC